MYFRLSTCHCSLNNTSMLFYVKLCLFLTVFTAELHGLIFNSSLSGKSLFLNKIISEFKLIFSVCLRYKSASEKLQSVMGMFFGENISIVFESDDECFQKECKNFLFFEVHSVDICNIFARTEHFYMSSYFSVIIVVLDINFDVETLESCVDVFDSANVFFVSLQNEEVFVLSSPTSPRRVFLNNNLSLPLSSQDRDLQGQVVRVSTFHYPPFTIIETDNTSG